MRAGFLALARAEPERCVVVDATRPVDAVADDIRELVRAASASTSAARRRGRDRERPAPRDNPELYGQDAALAVLGRALASGRLAHGWLLTGPPGIGKATLAFRFARALLAGPDAIDARLSLRPDHPVFRQVARASIPISTVLEAERDPRTGRLRSEITVDAVRAATASLQMTAAAGGYRVAMVDGAESMNRNAANALLKTLEEPPARSVLILVSHRPGSLAATIRSRCAKLRLSPLPTRSSPMRSRAGCRT